MAIATCHTPGCGNAGIPRDIGPPPIDQETGQPETERDVVCGVCSQPITDVQ